MVDVGGKNVTHRIAVAEGYIHMQPQTLQRIIAGDHNKGDVLGIARIAGIMGTKKTAELIPLCHPLTLTRIAVELQPLTAANAVRCQATAETVDRTGVEMEALTAVSVAALTLYDMCKAVDKGISISDIRLLKKSGGKSGEFVRE